MSLRTNLLRSALRAQPKAIPSRVMARRSFASDGNFKVPPPSPAAVNASKTPYFLGGLGLVLIGGAYYFFQPGVSVKDQGKKVDTAVRSVAASVEGKVGLRRGKEDYVKVYNRLAELLDADEDNDYDDGSYGPVFVRLAWHASGTYDAETNTGGSNFATMRFEPEAKHGANNGLNLARDRVELVKKEFDWISYGDLWTLGGVATIQEMAGPHVPWRPGRIDGFESDVTPDGRLPDASLAHDHLRQIFYRMGFNDQEIVALSGAHALGRCHTNRSGFDGPWTFSPTTFTNDYFKLLFDEKWSWKKWAGPKQYEDNSTKTLMMLPTDMAIVKDKSFRKTAEAYAKDEQLFFKDFSAVFAKLLELGVPTSQWAGEAWTMPTLDEQAEAKKSA